MNGSDRGVFTTYFDPGASHRPSWMTRVAAQWLDRQLDFSNWKQGAIAKSAGDFDSRLGGIGRLRVQQEFGAGGSRLQASSRLREMCR